MSNRAQYRKFNDHSNSSSTYHKKDGTNIRAKLKVETETVINEYQIEDENYAVETNKCEHWGERYEGRIWCTRCHRELNENERLLVNN